MLARALDTHQIAYRIPHRGKIRATFRLSVLDDRWMSKQRALNPQN